MPSKWIGGQPDEAEKAGRRRRQSSVRASDGPRGARGGPRDGPPLVEPEAQLVAVSLLDAQPDDRVLEIGFGPGLAIRELSRLAVEGYVCGIDHSELMLRRAKRLNAEGLERGVVDLRLGSVERLPAFEEPFDKILAVNAMMFWREPVARLEEHRNLLRSGGLIAVAHQPRGPGTSDETSAAEGRERAAALAQAGFSQVRLETMALKPAVVCALG